MLILLKFDFVQPFFMILFAGYSNIGFVENTNEFSRLSSLQQ
jgi:hypothetical protein